MIARVFGARCQVALTLTLPIVLLQESEFTTLALALLALARSLSSSARTYNLDANIFQHFTRTTFNEWPLFLAASNVRRTY